MIGNEIVYKNTDVSKNSQQNNSETVTTEHDKEISKERYIYISSKKARNYWWFKINNYNKLIL